MHIDTPETKRNGVRSTFGQVRPSTGLACQSQGGG